MSNDDLFLPLLVVPTILAFLCNLANDPVWVPWRRRPAQNLTQWLEIATGKLAPSAKTRIRTEIETHYAASLQSHLETGSLKPVAQIAALVDLGDAYAAARRFRREHLLEKDVTQISWCLKYSWSLLWVAFGCLLFIGPFSLVSLSHPASRFWGAAMLLQILVLVVASNAAYFLSREKTGPTQVRRIILLYAVSAVSFGGVTILWGGIVDNINSANLVKELLCLAYWVVQISYLSLNFLRLRKKLASAPETNLLPPTANL